MFPIPKGTALPSLPLHVPARTSDSCGVLELSPLQAGRFPGRIPGSRGNAGGDSAGIPVQVIPGAVSHAGQTPLMEAGGTEPSFTPPHGKAAFPGIQQEISGFSLQRVPGGIFPPGCGAWIPPGHAPNPIPEPAAHSKGLEKAQFPESFHACGDSRKRLLPALDPSPSRREKLCPGVLRAENGIGKFNWDKLKPAQRSQPLSFLLFPRNLLGRVGMLCSHGGLIPLSRSCNSPRPSESLDFPSLPIPQLLLQLPCRDPRQTQKVRLDPQENLAKGIFFFFPWFSLLAPTCAGLLRLCPALDSSGFAASLEFHRASPRDGNKK